MCVDTHLSIYLSISIYIYIYIYIQREIYMPIGKYTTSYDFLNHNA